MQDEIVWFDEKHLIEIELREIDNRLCDKDRILEIAKTYPTKTCIIAGKPASIFGVFPISERSYEMWSVTSVHAESHPITYHKLAKVAIACMFKKYDLVRLQSICLVNSGKSKKWLEKLGFKEEGVLRKYDSENDYYMMAKVI